MDILAAMRVFVRVVETGGFSAVARESGATQPTISRTIAALEEHLSVRLLNRSTRAVSVTEDGRLFYDHATRAIGAVDEAEAAVGRRRATPTGRLRVGSSVGFGRLHIAPRMGVFLDRFPQVEVELCLHDGVVDLVGEGLDLAIRIGELTDPTLIARRIGVARVVVVASHAYLTRRGTPVSPTDLTDHDCVIYTRIMSGTRWRFRGADGPAEVPVRGRFLTDNSEALREAVLAGAGLGSAPVWLFGPEIASGQVRIVLQEHEPEPVMIHAVYPSRRQVTPKVRAMIDFLAGEFQVDPLLSPYGLDVLPAPAVA